MGYKNINMKYSGKILSSLGRMEEGKFDKEKYL